jgi:hypothetical protein
MGHSEHRIGCVPAESITLLISANNPAHPTQAKNRLHERVASETSLRSAVLANRCQKRHYARASGAGQLNPGLNKERLTSNLMFWSRQIRPLLEYSILVDLPLINPSNDCLLFDSKRNQ